MWNIQALILILFQTLAAVLKSKQERLIKKQEEQKRAEEEEKRKEELQKEEIEKKIEEMKHAKSVSQILILRLLILIYIKKKIQ